MFKQRILEELQEFIDRRLNIEVMESKMEAPLEYQIESEALTMDMDDFILNRRKPTLNQLLFTFIDRSGEKDSEIYKKAGIDRKLFSKIRSNPDYHPSKNTIIALALALQLDSDETEDLLSTGGYSLSNSSISDLIITYFLEKNIYDLYTVNAALDHYNQKTL